MYIKREIKARLGMGTKIIATDNKLPSSQQGVGGQIAICKSDITQHIKRVKSDESGLGIYNCIGIQLQRSWFWAIGVYWPNMTARNTGVKGLCNQYHQFLDGKLPLGTVIDVPFKIRNALTKLISNCSLDPMNSLIVGGDWNLEQEQLT
jgi:hypothetical protein